MFEDDDKRFTYMHRASVNFKEIKCEVMREKKREPKLSFIGSIKL